MGKGMDSLNEEKKQRKQSAFSQQLAIKQKEEKLARIRFITNYEDCASGWFHSIPKIGRLGKPFAELIYCMRQKDEECEYCNNPKTMAVKDKYFFWVWVHEKLHFKPDENREWEKVEYLGEYYYLEPINKFQYLMTGPGFNDGIKNKFKQWFLRFKKTLLDRDYDWCREGFDLNTDYDLIPRDEKPTKLAKEIEEGAKELQPIDSVMELMMPIKLGKDKEEGSNDEEDLF